MKGGQTWQVGRIGGVRMVWLDNYGKEEGGQVTAGKREEVGHHVQPDLQQDQP